MSDLKSRLDKLVDLQEKSRNLFVEFQALIQLHTVAANRGDGAKEGELRNQLHATLDSILDISTEIKGL